MSKEKLCPKCNIEMTDVVEAFICTGCGLSELIDYQTAHTDHPSCQCDECIEKKHRPAINELKNKELTAYNDFDTSWEYTTGIQREEYFTKTQEYADKGIELTDQERYFLLWGERNEE